MVQATNGRWNMYKETQGQREQRGEGLRRWEKKRERQIKRTGWEVFYTLSLSSKTLISSIDSWLFRSLTVKRSSHTQTHTLSPDPHTHTFSYLSYMHTYTVGYYSGTGYEVPWGQSLHNPENFSSRNRKVCIFNCSLLWRPENTACQQQ